ncbi:MAG: hypothetical protein ABL916_12175 [Burkholderiaceae bacterium]
MGKPHGTFLQIGKTTGVVSRAADARRLEESTASRRRDELERLLRRSKLDLRNARRVAEECKNFPKAPESVRGRIRLSLIELLDHLNDFAEAAGKDRELSAELSVPAKTFITKAKNAQLDAVSIPQLAMAAVVFVLVIEKAYAKFRKG